MSNLNATLLSVVLEADPVFLEPAVHLHPLLAEPPPHGGDVAVVAVQEIAELTLGRGGAPRARRLRRAPFGGDARREDARRLDARPLAVRLHRLGDLVGGLVRVER